MRRLAVVCGLVAASCRSAPERPRAPEKVVVSVDPGALGRLQDRTRKARAFWKNGDRDEASALIVEGEADAAAVLAPSEVPVEALRTVSDRDQLWGEMLLAGGQAGHARMLFVKNEKRWQSGAPETEETRARLKEAREWVKRCDARLVK